jgi:triosephosphate isomerase
MRRKIVAGNWKMNLLSAEAVELVKEISKAENVQNEVECIVFPSVLFVQKIIDLNSGLGIGVQNFYPEESGAFTGEVSIAQVKDIGATYALVGHSERRSLFHETDELLRKKVDAALANGITPIFCCGEPLEIRNNKEELNYVRQQLATCLFHLTPQQMEKCIVAYEPIWAIGTGQTASVEQAEAMHAAIRSWIGNQFGEHTAEQISILYGGSCSTKNAAELFQCPNVDGGLIGGASLEAGSFLQIAQSF